MDGGSTELSLSFPTVAELVGSVCTGTGEPASLSEVVTSGSISGATVGVEYVIVGSASASTLSLVGIDGMKGVPPETTAPPYKKLVSSMNNVDDGA